MASYDAPDSRATQVSVFLKTYWNSSASSQTMTQAKSDLRYLKLAGYQTCSGTETFGNGIKSDSIAPNSASDITASSPFKINNASAHPVLNLKGTSTQFGTVQFMNNSESAQATMYTSSASGAVNIDTQSLTNGFQLLSSGTPYLQANTSAMAVSIPNTTFTGNISQATGYSATLRTTTVNGTITCSRIIDTGNCSVTGTTTLTGDVTAGNISCTGNVSAYSVSQSTPGVVVRSVGSLLPVTGAGTDVLVTWTTSKVANISSSLLSFSGGTFQNLSGSTKYYIVSYSVEFSGVNGGQRLAYIVTSNTAGNVPLNDKTAKASVLADARTVLLNGSSTVCLGNNGTFAIYVNNDSGSSINVLTTSYISITAL